MDKRGSIKTRISLINAVTIIAGIAVILVVLYLSLQSLANRSAQGQLDILSQKYSNVVNDTFNYPSDYVRTVVSDIEYFTRNKNMGREDFTDLLFSVFKEYPYIDGSAVMLEANVFDGRDAEYIGSDYGTVYNGRFSFYYFKLGGVSTCSPGVEDNELEYSQEYYTKPANAKKPIITEPYVYDAPDGGSYLMITISYPVFAESGDVMGVVTADIFLDKLFETLQNEKIYSSGYMALTNSDGVVIYSPRNEDIQKPKTQVGLAYPVSSDGSIEFSYADSILNNQRSLVATAPIKLSDIDETYYLSIVAPVNEITAEETSLSMLIAVLLLIVMVALIGITYAAVTYSLKPMSGLVEASRKIAEGNLQVKLPKTTNDEVGFLARNFELMTGTINNLIMDIQVLSAKHSEGQMDFRLDKDKYKGAYAQVVQNADKMAAAYAAIVLEVSRTTENFARGNFEVSTKEYPGQMAELSAAINGLKENLLSVKKEITMLVEAGLDGRLSTRANADNLNGDWKALLSGLNGILDAVISPITESQSVMKEMSNGNFGVLIRGDYKGDYALMKESVNGTVNAIDGYIHEITDVLDRLANGDLTCVISREYVGQFLQVKKSLTVITESLNRTLTEIYSASEQVLSGAKQISDTSMQLAAGTTQQAAAINMLDNAVESINRQIQTAAENAANANNLSIKSSGSAKAGNDEMQKMLQSMNGIKKSSANISEVIKVIEDIAFQTNLLALNASVEAARAGVHGKGFAVVANEVRSLASKSQESARNTSALIQDSISKVNDGTVNANTTASALNMIVGNTKEVSELISAIAATSDEQAKAILDISNSLKQISEVVQNNSSTSEEAAATAEELNSQAEMLKQLVSYFKLN